MLAIRFGATILNKGNWLTKDSDGYNTLKMQLADNEVGPLGRFMDDDVLTLSYTDNSSSPLPIKLTKLGFRDIMLPSTRQEIDGIKTVVRTLSLNPGTEGDVIRAIDE